MNTIPECYDDNFRPDTQLNSSVDYLKNVAKNSRIPTAENLILKTLAFLKPRQILPGGAYCSYL